MGWEPWMDWRNRENPYMCGHPGMGCSYTWAVVRVRSRWGTAYGIERICNSYAGHNPPNLDIVEEFDTEEKAASWITLYGTE